MRNTAKISAIAVSACSPPTSEGTSSDSPAASGSAGAACARSSGERTWPAISRPWAAWWREAPVIFAASVGDKPLDGRDLSPLLRKQDVNWPERTIFNHWNNNTSARTQRHRLDAQGQLYDMVSDPGQYRWSSYRTRMGMAAPLSWRWASTRRATGTRLRHVRRNARAPRHPRS